MCIFQAVSSIKTSVSHLYSTFSLPLPEPHGLEILKFVHKDSFIHSFIHKYLIPLAFHFYFNKKILSLLQYSYKNDLHTLSY